jgi:hypothetical protein
MGWSVMGGVIHGNGPNRGVLYTMNDYGEFRFIYSIRHLPNTGGGAHAPCILFWGTRTPLQDAIAGIQFQTPNYGTWDYRTMPVHINAANTPNPQGMPEFSKAPGAPTFDNTMWTQCEVLALSTGVAKMACCQPAGGPNMPCKAKEITDFNNSTAFHKGPFGLQVHNMGLHDEYKDIYVESPVADTTKLVTM